MMHLSLRTVSILLWVVGWNLAGYAQQGTPGPNMGEKVKVEGVVTAVQLKPGQGSPFLEVKSQDGKPYLVQLGPMQTLQQQGFSPKVNDKITVSGFLCCVAGGKQMVHSTEIAWAGKTYQTPMDPGCAPHGDGRPRDERTRKTSRRDCTHVLLLATTVTIDQHRHLLHVRSRRLLHLAARAETRMSPYTG